MSVRVLVVEDDVPTRKVLTMLLEDEGYSVDACVDGVEAMGHLGARPYQALVTDYIMPGISGLELVSRARSLHSGVCCVVVSGYTAPEGAEGVRWLPKPLDLDALLAALPPSNVAG